jgi:hypothetical protein
LAGWCLHSCEEIGPNIDLTSDTSADTTYIATQVETPQVKNVLLEEFTGVRCVNCPQAHELIENLESQHGERLVAVSDHSEDLAEPYDGDQDLRAPEAQQFEDLFGGAAGKPSGTVDRRLYSGESSLIVFTNKWAGYINQQLSQSSPVNIHLETDFNANSRDLEVVVTLHYTAEETEENKLTVLLLEDGIVTQQVFPGGVIDSHYVQNQVLRKALPSTNGAAVTASKVPGRVVVQTLTAENLPSIWNVENMRVVALVHRSGGTMDVLQAVEKEVE